MEYDFLIVGQGITGSILAIELEARKKKFKIINLNQKLKSVIFKKVYK